MAILRGQKQYNDCGPTCFANALNALGYDIKIEQANKLCNLQKEGTDSFDLIRAFERYGFDGKEQVHNTKLKAWQWLMQDTKRGLPIVLSVDNDTHWLLVLRAGKTSVQIIDPSEDMPSKITRKELMARWQCLDDESKYKYRFHGLAFEPFKDKSIKATQMRERLLATIDVG